MMQGGEAVKETKRIESGRLKGGVAGKSVVVEKGCKRDRRALKSVTVT